MQSDRPPAVATPAEPDSSEMLVFTRDTGSGVIVNQHSRVRKFGIVIHAPSSKPFRVVDVPKGPRESRNYLRRAPSRETVIICPIISLLDSDLLFNTRTFVVIPSGEAISVVNNWTKSCILQYCSTEPYWSG